MPSGDNRRRNTQGRRVWIAVGVAVLAIVTIVLSVVALGQFRAAPDAAPTPLATPLPTPSDDAVTPEPTPPAPPRVVPAPVRLLGAVDAERAYRVTAGTCPEPVASAAFTSDSGATWEGMDLVGITNSAANLAFVELDRLYASMVTLAGDTCAPQGIRTYVGGTNWETSPDVLAGAWWFDSRNPAIVHSPDGDVAAPCTVAALAPAGEGAAVLCSDEQVFVTSDRGATWPVAATVTGASAIARGVDGFDVLVLNQNGCLGVQVLPLTADLQPGTAGACLSGDVGEGDAALSTGNDGTLWVWAGDLMARSADRGATWM